jgi:hypothetical protein
MQAHPVGGRDIYVLVREADVRRSHVPHTIGVEEHPLDATRQHQCAGQQQ